MTEPATLNHLLFAHLDQFQREKLLVYPTATGEVVYSSERFARAVFTLCRQFDAWGLAPGDRVAIFSENRPEWHIADFAILLGRRVAVPVYSTLSESQIEYLLRHSGCGAAVVAGASQAGLLMRLRPCLPELRRIVSIEETPGADTSLAQLEAGPPLDAAARDALRREALAVDPQSLATIVYTSGTTGTPKGVMLSHANLVFNVVSARRRLLDMSGSQALSLLPLAHVLERVLCYGYFREGMAIAYGDPYRLKELLRRYRPQMLGCVPRMLEKIREAVEEQIDAAPGWRRAVGRRLIRAGMARARRQATFADRLLAALAGPLVYRRLRAQLGPVRAFVCGGARLDPEVELFFRAAGFTVLQGYGMTETSPVITFNLQHAERVGSVGRALDGVEVRLTEEGELLTRGPHVMLGYYQDPEATRAVLRDGWLATGDLARIDPQGFVTITGRRKEILVLSNGKNIACAAVEQALESSPYIQQAFVVGDGRSYLTALLVPHLAHVAEAARQRGCAFGGTPAGLLTTAVVDLFRQELARVQAALAHFEQVKRFCFLPEDALLDPELVTPTQKVRRAVLHLRYAGAIDCLYRQEQPFLAAPDSG